MNKEALLFPVHIAILLMVLGFGIFFTMIFWDVKKVVKRGKKYSRKFKKGLIKAKRNLIKKKNWFYEI
jgi:hypothetical protein